MEPEVLDASKTEEAVPSGESSTQEKTAPAKEAGTEPGDGPAQKGETSQEKSASEGESDDSKLPFNNHPRWKEVYGENKEMKGFISELKEIGIESKDHAEAIVRDAENFHVVVEQLRERPEEFWTDLRKEFPKVYEQHHVAVLSQMLDAWADAFRRQGDSDGTTKSEVLEEIRKSLNGNATKPRTQESRTNLERESLDNEKWELFSDQVVSERNSAFAAKIEELLPKSIEFPSAKHKAKFVSEVVEDVLDSLVSDKVFVRELESAENPRRGLGKQQRQEAVKVYTRYGFNRDGRLFKTAIAEQASLMNLAGAGTGNGTKRVERKEALGGGAPSSGTLTTADKAKIREDIEKRGLSGNKAMEAYLAEVRKRMLSR